MDDASRLMTIGRTTLVTIGGKQDVPAKVDTGADSSSVWATDIHEVGGELRCKLFGPASTYYTGKELVFRADEFQTSRFASSTGNREARYTVQLPVSVIGQEFFARFSLADRATMMYPILLGRDFLSGRFMVDVREGISNELHEKLKSAKQKRIMTIGIINEEGVRA